MTVAKTIYHGGAMTQSELTNETNRGREVLARPRERSPVLALSMIGYVSPQLIDSGSTGPNGCDCGVVVPRWSA